MRGSFTSLAVAATLASGCMGIEDPVAYDEPIVVDRGNFKHGKLPGTKSDVKGRPNVTSLDLVTGSLRAGANDVPLAGRTTESGFSVGVRLLGEGSGYWVRPVGAFDPLVPTERTWSLSFDVGREVEPGRKKLGVVAFDKEGRAGKQSSVEVCVLSDLPDNGNVCDETNEPPAAIASLRWNTDADLDLIVIAPDGTRYSRSNFSQVVDGEVVARLDFDSTSNCFADAQRIENFVWSEKPARGTWYVYANLFDACEKSAVNFELTVYRKKTNGDGTFSLVETKSVGGELLRAQTQVDATKPLYLTKIEFP